MSETTGNDTEIEEAEAMELTLEERVEALEGHIKGLYEQHKNILEHFREIAIAVSEVASAAATEEE